MAGPEAWRRDLAAYPRRETVQTRFQDVDIFGHINNVAMAGLFEHARGHFNRGPDSEGHGGLRFLIARVEINYLGEAFFPDDIVIGSGVGAIGTRSWQILSGAFQNDICVATCDTTLVLARDAGSAIPDDYRGMIAGKRILR